MNSAPMKNSEEKFSLYFNVGTNNNKYVQIMIPTIIIQEEIRH